MPAIIKLQLFLETLAEVISFLDLEEKFQLQEIIDQQIFEAEEALYEDDALSTAEIQAVRDEYVSGESMTIKEYVTSTAARKSKFKSIIG
ncbi:MAG: hypothetical protein AAFV71_33020 [Cyanobacteria bacterium J06633_8]